MSTEIFIILAVIIIGFVTLFLLLQNQIKSQKSDPALLQWLGSLQSDMRSSNNNVNTALRQSYQDLFSRLDQVNTLVSDLKKEAGEFTQVSKTVRDLHNLLNSPKLRGGLGEQVLTDLISQMFPKNAIFLQHRFKTGAIVDAAIKTNNGILPIDSKFPMENFQKLVAAETDYDKESFRKAFIRDVTKHIKDISEKYISSEDGTLDFALMYLPSESVYYEVVCQNELLELARHYRVYPVSPTTLYSHLQTVLLSFQGAQIETKSKAIMAILNSLQSDYVKLEGNLGTLNRHLTNAYNQLNTTQNSFNTLGQKLTSIKQLEE
jgi:DNA recombination protein RmuC